MEKEIIANYIALIDKSPIIIIEYFENMARTLWTYLRNMNYPRQTYRDSIYCQALMLISRYKGPELNKHTLISDSVFIAGILISHPQEDIEYPINENIRAIINYFDGKMYFPTALDIFDLIESNYHITPENHNSTARRLVSCALASPKSSKLTHLAIAVGVISLMHAISVEKYIINLPYGQIDKNLIDNVHNAIVQSPILNNQTLSPEIIAKLHTYIPTTAILMEELSYRISLTYIKDISVQDTSLITSSTFLGRGVFGTVSAITTTSGDILAHKEQHLVDHYIREIVTMKTLDHPNIAKIISLDVSDLSFRMKLASNDLGNFLSLYKPSKLLIRNFIKELFSAVAYIHSYGIQHGDLKPSNILIYENNVLAIADFGSSIGFMTPERKSFSVKHITPLYRPLDLLMNDNRGWANYSFDADVWSCGVIATEINGKYPFLAIRTDNVSISEIIRGITNVRGDGGIEITKYMDADIGLVVRQCFAPPSYRPTAAQCLNIIN